MAPPTQAGKFKPRKPAKPITVGAAAAPGVPIAVPSSSTAASDYANRTSKRPGRGAGRGRGGGRGAGFPPQQQGQVFFTGNNKPDAHKRGSASSVASKSTAAQGGAAGARGSAFSKIGPRAGTTDVQEEVVGFMEEGVGSSRATAVAVERLSGRKYDDSGPTNNSASTSNPREKTGSAMDRYVYDSDSSDDESRSVQSKFLQPIQLPIPNSTMHPSQALATTESSNKVLPIHVSSTLSMTSSKLDEVAPFASPDDTLAVQKEMDSFFLCQLPTRLVPFHVTNDKLDRDNVASEAPIEQQQAEVSTPQIAIPAIHEDSFDNVLSRAEPGRLGKLIVLKTVREEHHHHHFRTELLMCSILLTQFGCRFRRQVRMNVSEGLSCGFRQYVASIDTPNAQLVALGTVHKTLVVTPNLDKGLQL